MPGRLSGARQAASIVWALAPLYTCGLLGFAVIAGAAVRLRSWFHGMAAFGYLFLVIVAFTALDGDDAAEALGALIWAAVSIGSLVHALLIRERVFRPTAPFPLGHPGVTPGHVPPGHALGHAPAHAATPPPGPAHPRPPAGPMPYPGVPVTPAPAPAGPAPVPPALGATPSPHRAAPPLATPRSHAPGSWRTPPGPAAGGPREWPTAPGRDTPPERSPHRRFGPYLLLDKLGAGGQGAVYLAEDRDGSRVALKILHHRLTDKEREGFIREVTAAQRVPSYSTARVIDAGVLDGVPYIVSEYVSGVSLQRRVEESGPLGADSLIRLAIATSGALAAIHRAGIVHRDFKPANVLLAPDGPRVIDFGVAKALDQVTTTAGLKGTPLYMSPEQINGDPVTPASDMFSWGSTMIYGGTGRVAFSGTNPYQVLHQIMSQEPDLSGLPGPLVRPVAACLDKDPRNRPQAAELIAAITG